MRRKLSLETILNRLIEAEGTLEEYKPFIHVEDFGSKGEVARTFGKTTGRTHHLLSRLEQAVFLILDYNPNIVDIREQFPLTPLSQTIAISNQLNVKHPTDPFSKFPIFMTTDFLLTIATDNVYKDLAVCVKTREDFNKPRTQEKLRIEREFWRQKGIRWVILLEDSINWTLVENLKELDKLPTIHENIDSQMDRLESLIFRSPECPLEEIFRIFETESNHQTGYGYLIFKHLLVEHRLDLDLRREINLKEGLNENKRNLP